MNSSPTSNPRSVDHAAAHLVQGMSIVNNPSASTPPASARTVLALLGKLKHGVLDMQLPDGSQRRFGQDGPSVFLQIHNWNVFTRALKSGDIGFAEGFISGEWTTPDLTALLSLLVANRDELEQVVYGSWWGALWFRLKHWRNRNSLSGSAKNVHAHYDLGNAFYALWLDHTMSYSSALFGGDLQQPLAQAQRAKLRRSLEQAGVAKGSRVLEIGCGWGGLAEMAAQEFGAHVTGLTLSKEQLVWAQRRVANAGVAQQCELRLQDYRALTQHPDFRPFDAVVSIEMFEAVGREYWAAYFDTLRGALKPGGLACVQTITLREDLFERYARSSDFLQQYIFPGGLLPTADAFEALAHSAGFEVVKQLAFGLDYAETLRRWRLAFTAQEEAVVALGFDARFVRIWHYYLALCEAAFLLGNTNVVQFTLRKR